jgi:MFS family permease
MANVLFKKEYPAQYTSVVSTRVSNSLLVGAICGQLCVGLTCDYLGRKTAIVITTLLIVVGGILATAAHGITIDGMFWMLTVARGIVGFGVGKSHLFDMTPFVFNYIDLAILNHPLTRTKAASIRLQAHHHPKQPTKEFLKNEGQCLSS